MTSTIRLSKESYTFLKNRKADTSSFLFQQQALQYVKDLQNVMQSLCRQLNSSDIIHHGWTVKSTTFEPTDNKIPNVIFVLSSSSDHYGRLKIQIKGHNQSTLSFHHSSHNMDISIDAFKNSAAYKRYYQDQSNDTEFILKACISNRQLLSKYFGDYILHLIQHMAPAIKCVNSASLQEAA
jgi:hypothetical protein